MIPIYRAKRKDNGEYVIGFYMSLDCDYIVDNEAYIEEAELSDFTMLDYLDYDYIYEIDPSTLAIHFPDTKDKNNKPIFASLNEDGVGGDEFNFNHKPRYDQLRYEECIGIFKWSNNELCYKIRIITGSMAEYVSFNKHSTLDLAVTGIYEGDK